jgi:predicted permease
MRSFFGDLRYAFRALRNSPGFTAAAVLTLALGIAANATVFGWIDTLLLHPYAGVGGRDWVAIETVSARGEYSNTSYRDYRDYRERLQSFSGLAASLFNAFNVGPVNNPRRIFGEYVSGNYFAVLGVKPVRGRAFLPQEYSDASGASPVIVISYRLWKDLLHGDAGAVGKTLRVNRQTLTVVGIAPEEFRGTMPGMAVEMWVPMNMGPAINGQGDWLLEDRTQRQMWIMGRLKPGISLAQANAEAEACAHRIAEESPNTSRGFLARAMPVWKAHFGLQRVVLEPLRILMAVCLILFLIVGANVANLQLARAITRQKEMSVRMALGAYGWRLTRQLLAESSLLAAMGATVAVPLASWLADSLLWVAPPMGFPLAIGFELNADVLGFTLLLCCTGALLTGLAPALQTMNSNLVDTLKERGGTAGARQNRPRNALVVCEVALALVALVGTALFGRSFQNVRAIYPGLDAHNVLFAKYHLDTFCSNPKDRADFCLRLRDRIRNLPGIAGVSFANNVPLELGQGPISDLEVEGYAPRPDENLSVMSATVAPQYFDILRIPLLRGRDFTEQDDRGTAPVVVVNRTFAQRYFGGADPIGRRLKVDSVWSTITGEVADSKYHSVTDSPAPYLYMAYRQRHGDEFWTGFFIRTEGPARNMEASIRREAAALNPDAGVTEVVEYEDMISAWLYEQRMAAALLAVLGAVSLLLAALGLYSVLAYAVSQRRHELGIRMALGADPAALVRLVLRQGLAMTAVGIAVGTVLAIAVMRMAAGLLVGVSPDDPAAIAGAAAFLAIVALLASYLPARRALRVDPMVTLRES